MRGRLVHVVVTSTDNLQILFIRGRKVLLSTQLAPLYGVPIQALNQAVRRNKDRFPEDFMFELTREESIDLRLQGSSESGRGRHSKYPPIAFTQEGVAMLSSVLRSKRAVATNIAIMREFVKLRELMSSNRELAQKIDALERRHEAQFKVVFNSIRELIQAKPKEIAATAPTPQKKSIGFGRE